MSSTIDARLPRRNRRAASPIDAERARIRALAPVRLLVRFGLTPARAVLTAEAFGLVGGDR